MTKYGLVINFVRFNAIKFAQLLNRFSEIAQSRFDCELDLKQEICCDEDGCPDCRLILECNNEDCIMYLSDVYTQARNLARDIDLFDVREHKAPEAERRQRIRKVE